MKRIVSVICAIAASAVLALALTGCQEIGIGAPSGKPNLKKAQVTTPAIHEQGVLKVGVNAQNAPFSTDMNGKIVGIDVDVAAALANELGLAVEIVDIGTDAEQALADGKVDIIMGMDKSDTAATCWLSDPYLETAVAMYATSNGAILPAPDSKPSIEAQASSMSAWEVSNQYGEESLNSVEDLKTAFEDLASGKTSFVAADVVLGSYINRTSKTNAQIIGLLQNPGGYCIGVSAASNDLKMAVSNALDVLKNTGIISVIQKKWLGADLKLDGYALSEAAGAAAEKKPDDPEGVGSNAVDPSEGQPAEETAEVTPIIEEGYSYEYVPEPEYYDDSADTGYVEQETYVDNGGQEYVEAADEGNAEEAA